MSFPTALPNAKTDYDNNDDIASADQNSQNEDINELATAIGITGSTDVNSLEYRVTNAVVLEVATGAEINTATDNVKYVTALAIEDSNLARSADLPVKASGAETNTGTNDTKFVTPLSSMIAKTTVTAYTPAGAGTTTLDLSLGNTFRVTMPATTQTLAISNATVGQYFVVEIVNVTDQGALTWFSSIKWAEGVAMALTDVNTKIDVAGFRVVSAGNYLGFIAGQNL
jgi:hypothetical protein